MDENYLDRLLQEVEGQDNLIDEIGDISSTDEIPSMSRTSSGISSSDDKLEHDLTMDASTVRDVAWSDAEIPVNEISELDELDDLADLDMEDLDFEDIDFDEIHSDSMMNPNQLEREMEDLMNLEIDENYFDDPDDQDFEEEFKRIKESKKSTESGLSGGDSVNNGADGVRQSEINTSAAMDSNVAPPDSLDLFETGESGVDSFGSGFMNFDSADSDRSNSGSLGSDASDSKMDGSEGFEGNEASASGDADMDIDALMSEVFGDVDGASGTSSDAVPASDADSKMDASAMSESIGNRTGSEASEEGSSITQGDSEDPLAGEMDDLFAMLGIDGDEAMKEATSMPDLSGEAPDFEIPPELQDIPDIHDNGKEKKSKFMELLFGSDEEEEETLTPEQEEALAQEKEAKKQAKLEKKEAKEKEKAEKAEKKKQAKEDKSAKLQAKKDARKAEEERILAEEGPEKKLNKPLVVITILFFLAIGGFVIVGTNIFDYSLVISRARNYFERQKYGAAYREIVGVEVKEKDKELESRIYTVMYVERQSEAYENYVKMNRPDLALDALLSGLDKYDVYYEEAVVLDIVSDLDYAKTKILSSLQSQYGLSEEDAKKILEQNPYEYTRSIQTMTEGMDFTGDDLQPEEQ